MRTRLRRSGSVAVPLRTTNSWALATYSRWPTSADSYGVVQEMRFAPFGWKDVTRLAAAAAAPLLPLALTIYTPDELVGYLFKVLF